MQLHTSRTENGSECSDYASVVSDDPADVFWMNSEFEHGHRLALDRVNLHLCRIVHQCLRNRP